MPISGAKYRVKTFKSGKKVRLAFKGGKVVETKSAQTGEIRHPNRDGGKRKMGRMRGRGRNPVDSMYNK